MLFPLCFAVLAVLAGLNGYYLYSAHANLSRQLDTYDKMTRTIAAVDTRMMERAAGSYAAFSLQQDSQLASVSLREFLKSLEILEATLPTQEASVSQYVRERLDAVGRDADALQPILTDLSTKTAARQALSHLRTAAASIDQVRELILSRIRTQIDQTRQEVEQFRTGLLAIGLAFVLSALGWIGILVRENRIAVQKAKTESARADKLAHQLDHDPKTGLINHSIFAKTVTEAFETRHPGDELVVMRVDLESRVPVIDGFGHAIDDAVLRSATDVMRHVIDTIDLPITLGRSAGKGFLLLFKRASEMDLSAEHIASRIQDQFLRPVATAHGSYVVTPAIGFADSRASDAHGSDIIRNADLAVANAVQNTKRRPVTYEPVMRAHMERHARVEAALARAIEANECLPHFQPQFNLKTGRIFGVEALARWYHSELGWISPSEFIPIAESSGDIVPMGWKILETSCAEVQLLPSNLQLSVNLSVAQILNDDVVAMVDECLGRTGLPAQRLKLEITESTLMKDLERVKSTLTELRNFGIGISLDDFGVGYSALSYLTDFHWDEIKIDRSFVCRAVRDQKLRDILKMVLGIAKTMGSDVLIEGIETVEQRDILVDLGCENGQGYLFGGPMAIDDITTLFFPDHKQRSFAG
ncbi:diguanylate cyclase (GGDEF) domain-containing protein [Roseibium denhamense]|uniref:Diguanylate cyclase (GGDEF) domain-containing protein n=1 Tax=Roseibium denhamense TaxID=76305 RepID=A0ABY1NPS5_9HYPH|nr:diguanylate cyclase (GGDEF) domain-containing protein [Roseibium denhamense]